MMCRLLVGVGQLYHIAVVVGAPQKSYAGRQVVASETRGDDNRRDEDEKRVDVGRALLVNERRIAPSLMKVGWCSTALCTMASSLLSAITLRKWLVNSSRAKRYS
jgi:hypothetical protein